MRIEAKPTDDLDAYELYLLGRNRWTTRSPETIREAIDYFEAAVEVDSTFALAFSGIADAYMVLPFYDLTAEPLDVYPQAKAAASRAMELDPSLGEVNASLGFISHLYELNWEAAERFLSTAVELAPGYPSAHHWYSSLLQSVGRLGEAVAEIEEAVSLDPRSNVLVWAFADRLHAAGRIEEARERYEQAIAMEPPVPWAIVGFAMSLGLAEPTDAVRAGELWAQAAALFGYPFPDRWVALVLGGTANKREVQPATLKDQNAAQEVLDDVVEKTVLERADLLFAYCFAAPADGCFDVLEEALTLKHFWVGFVPGMALEDRPDILEDPRWDQFLNRIGYPGARE
jgi:tetratricopeptide (TPR) repeat protein